MKLFLWLAPALALLQLDFVVHRGNSINDRGIDRKPLVKKDSFEIKVENERLFYLTLLEIGSLKQKVEVLVDTGSSDLWVPANNCSGSALYSYRKRSMGDQQQQHGRRRVLDYLDASVGDKSELNHKEASPASHKQVDAVVDRVPVPTTGVEKVSKEGKDGVQRYYYTTYTYSYYYYTNYYTNYGTYDYTSYYTNYYNSYSQYYNSYTQYLTNYYLRYSDYYLRYSTYYTGYYSNYYKTYHSGELPTASRSDASACTKYGTYETGKSENVKVNETLGLFQISYSDGSYAYGEYVTDDVTIDGKMVKGLNFAVCDLTDSEIGVLGIGFPALQGSYFLGVTDESFSNQYENLPMLLKLQGIIKKNLYSVALGKNNALEGSIVFGGVDHSKYSGTLQRVKILNRYEKVGEKNPVYLEIALTSITGKNLAVNYRTTVLLDTGATNNYLPAPYLRRIGKHLRGTEDDDGYWEVDCDLLDLDEEIVFGFSGANISVPVKDLIVQSVSGRYCYLGIFEDNKTPSLGDSFLRNAYVVYDLDNYEIALAQASDGSGEADIEEVTGDIPGALKAQYYDFTSVSEQFQYTKLGSKSKLVVFTELFSDPVPEATPLTTDDSWSAESNSDFEYSSIISATGDLPEGLNSYPGLGNMTASFTAISEHGPDGSSFTMGNNPPTNGDPKSLSLSKGDANKVAIQGPLYIVLALLTALLLI